MLVSGFLFLVFVINYFLSDDEKNILLLAQGEFESFTSFDSTLNAQTYENFIFSWWYYKQTWTYISGTTTLEAPRATFYEGVLSFWDYEPGKS